MVLALEGGALRVGEGFVATGEEDGERQGLEAAPADRSGDRRRQRRLRE